MIRKLKGGVDAGGGEVADAVAELDIDASEAPGAPSASAGAEPGAHAAVRCATGEVAVLLSDEESCVVECKSSASCPPGWSCDGEGPISHNGKAGAVVRFCRAVGHAKSADAGPTPAAVADAGKTSATPAPDAGAPGAPGKRLDVKEIGGRCPPGYQTCGAMCRLSCSKDSDCGLATAHCKGGFCMGPGAQPCGK